MSEFSESHGEGPLCVKWSSPPNSNILLPYGQEQHVGQGDQKSFEMSKKN